MVITGYYIQQIKKTIIMKGYSKKDIRKIVALLHFHSVTLFGSYHSQRYIFTFLRDFKTKETIHYRNRVILWGDKEAINYLNKKAREEWKANLFCPFTTIMDEIKCPECEEEISISENELYELYEEGDHEIDCPHCKKAFIVESEANYSFESKKCEEEEEENFCSCISPKQSLFPDGLYYCLGCFKKWYV